MTTMIFLSLKYLVYDKIVLSPQCLAYGFKELTINFNYPIIIIIYFLELLTNLIFLLCLNDALLIAKRNSCYIVLCLLSIMKKENVTII